MDGDMPTGPFFSNSTSLAVRHLQKSETPNPGLRIGSLFLSRTPKRSRSGVWGGRSFAGRALGRPQLAGKLRRNRARHPVVEPSALPTVSARSLLRRRNQRTLRSPGPIMTGETADKAYRRSISLRRFSPRIISFSALDKPMASICTNVSFIHSSPCSGPKG